jgi:hypothetical protein
MTNIGDTFSNSFRTTLTQGDKDSFRNRTPADNVPKTKKRISDIKEVSWESEGEIIFSNQSGTESISSETETPAPRSPIQDEADWDKSRRWGLIRSVSNSKVGLSLRLSKLQVCSELGSDSDDYDSGGPSSGPRHYTLWTVSGRSTLLQPKHKIWDMVFPLPSNASRMDSELRYEKYSK